MQARGKTNLIDGGVPAGIKMPPEDEGCRTNNRRIRIITRQGNSNTNPKGMATDEFPFNRILRLKKASRGEVWPFSRGRSSRGRLGAEGTHFATR